MIAYVLDIERKDTETHHLPYNSWCDGEDEMKAQLINMYTGLIRGYTLDRITMIYYYRFMKEIIGKYMHIEVNEIDVPDNLSDDELGVYITAKIDNISTNMVNGLDNIISDIGGHVLYNRHFSLIKMVETEHKNRFVCYTDSMFEFIGDTMLRELDILEEVSKLIDPVFTKYLYPFKKDERIIEFKQLIYDNLLPLLDDCYSISSQLKLDPYEMLHWYMATLRFLDY